METCWGVTFTPNFLPESGANRSIKHLLDEGWGNPSDVVAAHDSLIHEDKKVSRSILATPPKPQSILASAAAPSLGSKEYDHWK